MPRHKSASQIETFRLCQRKWAFRYIDEIPGAEPSAATQLGKRVHACLERWLKAEPLDLQTEEGQIAMSGLQHLPAPMTVGMYVEREFALDLAGHRVVGVKDVEIPERVPPLIVDHKTTKDFKWAKTRLAQDVQAALYAADVMIKTNTSACELRWVYYQTKGLRRSLPVVQMVTREAIEPTLVAAVDTMNEMDQVLQANEHSNTVLPTPSACDAYGGCKYRNICQPGEQVMSQTNFDEFLNKLKQGPQAVNPPKPVGVAPTTTVSTTLPELVLPKIDKPTHRVVDNELVPIVSGAPVIAPPYGKALAHCADMLESAAKMLRELAK